MTICGVFAALQGADVPETVVGVYADSRVTSNGQWFEDGTAKLFPLSRRCCATAAGRVNGFLQVIKERGARSDDADGGLWTLAGDLFRSVLTLRPILAERSPLTVLVAGFLSDGSPAVAEARFAGHNDNSVFLYRPSPGEVVNRTAGVNVAARIMAEGARWSVSRACDMSYLSSTLRGVIESQTVGIGGAMSYGICSRDGTGFRYPTVSLGGSYFRLGKPTSPPSKDDEVVALTYHEELYERLHREDQEVASFIGGQPTAQFNATPTLCTGTPSLFTGPEPSWALNPQAEVPSMLWFGMPDQREGMGFEMIAQQESALHPREVVAVEHHKAGTRIPAPPPPDAKTPPSFVNEVRANLVMPEHGGDLGPMRRPSQWDWPRAE